MRARIIGTGSYVPERIISSAEIAASFEEREDWIVERTGIRERRAAAPGEATSDLAAKAGRAALEMANVDPASVDLIIVATVTGDMPTPATAALVQHALGCRNAFAFDLSAACAGFLYALSVADQYLRAPGGGVRRALVIGAEVLTRFLDWDDRATCIVFGDGAGAVLLERSEVGDEARGVLSTHLHTDGALADILGIPGLGSRHPASPETLATRLHTVHMNGREVFKAAVRTLVGASHEALSANGATLEQVRHVFCHQANIRILEAVMDRLGLPMERLWRNIHKFGNTSAASVPMALDEAHRGGNLNPGDLVLMLAVGAGVSWGSALVRW